MKMMAPVLAALLLTSPLQAQQPPTPGDPTAPAEASTERTAEGLSKEIVEKLTPEQLSDVLKKRAVHVAPRLELSRELMDKLTPEQIVEVLKSKEQADASSSLGDVLVPVLVPLFFFLCVGFVVALPLVLGFRRHGQRQETLRLMVEKGAQIPPELLSPPVTKRSDLQRGVVLLAAGVGLSVFLAAVDAGKAGAWTLGLIPALIGAGYLLVWKLEQREKSA